MSCCIFVRLPDFHCEYLDVKRYPVHGALHREWVPKPTQCPPCRASWKHIESVAPASCRPVLCVTSASAGVRVSSMQLSVKSIAWKLLAVRLSVSCTLTMFFPATKCLFCREILYFDEIRLTKCMLAAMHQKLCRVVPKGHATLFRVPKKPLNFFEEQS